MIMFLDTFMDDASEGIMQNPVPDLEDLQLECVVSLEAAYNDMMLETCQLKYQELTEGVSVINEGVVGTIKNFFKKIINAIKKFFGFSSNNDGATKTNIDKLKNQIKNSNNCIAKGIKYMVDHPELNKKYRFIDIKSIIPAGDMVEDTYLRTALDNSLNELSKLQEEFNRNGKVLINPHDIAAKALRTFIESSKVKIENKIDTTKINSVADFKKTIDDSVKYISLNELLGKTNFNDNRDIDSFILNCLSSLLIQSTRASQFKQIIERQMEKYRNDVTAEIEEKFPRYGSVACEVANTLTQACIICVTFGDKICNKEYNDYFRLVSEAREVYAKYIKKE